MHTAQHGFKYFNDLIKQVFPDAKLAHNIGGGLFVSSEYSIELNTMDIKFKADILGIDWTNKESIKVGARKAIQEIAGLIFDSNVENRREQ